MLVRVSVYDESVWWAVLAVVLFGPLCPVRNQCWPQTSFSRLQAVVVTRVAVDGFVRVFVAFCCHC